jgi:phosphoribosylanthranilate isomerase
MKKTKVKICCIKNIEEAELAISFGASAIGLVSEMPSGPGVISDESIIEISNYASGKVDTFLLTSKQDSDSIIQQLKKYKTTTVQIVDRLTNGSYSDIKLALPSIKIIQVLHVNNDISIDEAKEIENEVDAILLDSGNNKLFIKELGGTGRTHDWSVSKRIVETVNIPIYLAGGLNPSNVAEAVKTVKPYSVDVCSGVRTNDKLDKNKLTKFFNSLNSIN